MLLSLLRFFLFETLLFIIIMRVIVCMTLGAYGVFQFFVSGERN